MTKIAENTDEGDLLEAITREYQQVGKLRGPIVVPEWKTQEDKPFNLYYRLNTGKEDALMADCLDNPTDKGVAAYLCLKLLKSTGERFLSDAAATVMLNRGYAGTMGRIASQIISDHSAIANPDIDLGESSPETLESGLSTS